MTASGGEPSGADRDLLAACAREPLGCVPGHAVLVPGVERVTLPREATLAQAAAWTLPADVGFALALPPRIDGPWLVLRGDLVNRADARRRVFLVEAGAGVFHATLVGEGLVRRPSPQRDPACGPPPPHLFPEPQGFDLAPGVRWPFETRIALPCWDLPPGQPLRAHWWFAIANASVQGDAAL